MWVVQTWPPRASVDSRRTSTPTSRANTSVSTSQNTGNCAASCWMGQCPWHSWTLESAAGSGALASIDAVEATNPSRLSASDSACARAVMSGPAAFDLRCVAAFHLGEAFDGELPHRVGSGHFAEALQRQGGDVQVVVAERGLALGAEDVAACGAAGAGAGAGDALDLDHAVRGTDGPGGGGPRRA